MEKTDKLISKYIENLIDYIPNIIGAFAILLIGLWTIHLLKKLAEKIFVKNRLDPTFISFLLDVIIWGLRILLFITMASKLGIETTSFVAILGAMSLAIGLSLQGSLANFSGGVLIILFKPFRIGDTIEAQSELGKVVNIHVFSTKIVTSQNQVVYIPNGVLSNSKIKNYSQNNLRKTNLKVSTPISIESSKFIEQLRVELISNTQILNKPEPKIYIDNVSVNDITYSIQVWVENTNVSDVSSYILQKAREISFNNRV